jgi:hypothetical protein
MTENDVEWIHAGLGLAGVTTPVDAERLRTLWGGEICLMGGPGPALERWLPAAIRASLIPPRGDAVEGAFRLAREAAVS